MTTDDVIGEFMRSAPHIDGVAETHYLDANAMAAEIVRLRACTGGRMTRACATCACWDAADPDADSGLCRRHAPRPTVGHDGSITTDWAITERADWCGEYEATREATT